MLLTICSASLVNSAGYHHTPETLTNSDPYHTDIRYHEQAIQGYKHPHPKLALANDCLLTAQVYCAHAQHK